MMETNSPSLISTLMRRRTKVLVGPCSKYFSTFRRTIRGELICIYIRLCGLAEIRFECCTVPNQKPRWASTSRAVGQEWMSTIAFCSRIESPGSGTLSEDSFENESNAIAIKKTAIKSMCLRNITPPPRFLPQSSRQTTGWCDPHSGRTWDRGLPYKLLRRRDVARGAIP